MKYFIIPGNPSAKYYYQKWVNELQEEYIFDEFKTVMYPLFSNELSPEEYFESMISFYEKEIKSYAQNSEINIIGHSIGGYMALKALERCPELIKKCIMVFPFMGNPAPVGKGMLRLTSILENSKCGFDFFMNRVESLKFFIPPIKFVERDEFKAGIRLGHFERLYFAKKNALPVIDPKLKSKVVMYYNSNDNWCTPLTVNAMVTEKIKTEHVKAKHDFIVSASHRKTLTSIIV